MTEGETHSLKLSSDLGRPVMAYASQLPIHYFLKNKIFKNSEKRGTVYGGSILWGHLSMSKDILGCHKVGEGVALPACSG